MVIVLQQELTGRRADACSPPAIGGLRATITLARRRFMSVPSGRGWRGSNRLHGRPEYTVPRRLPLCPHGHAADDDHLPSQAVFIASPFSISVVARRRCDRESCKVRHYTTYHLCNNTFIGRCLSDGFALSYSVSYR